MDFRNAIIVMTSNLGSDLITRETGIGFSIKSDEGRTERIGYERMKDKVLEEVKRFFRPEFLNRVDATVVFHALSREHIHSIVDLMMNMVRAELADHKVSLEITEAVRDFLAEKGYDPVFGARPLRRLIQNEIEDRLSEEVLGGRLHAGDTAYIDVEEGEIVIRSKVPALSEA